jgi:hypothetical protein
MLAVRVCVCVCNTPPPHTSTARMVRTKKGRLTVRKRSSAGTKKPLATMAAALARRAPPTPSNPKPRWQVKLENIIVERTWRMYGLPPIDDQTKCNDSAEGV